MAMNLAKETFSTERKYFEAGTDIRVTTAVKPAAAALEAHAPVILDDDGKVKAVASTDLTDLSGLYGITADSVEAADDDAGSDGEGAGAGWGTDHPGQQFSY